MARQPQLSSLSLFNSPTVEQARRQRRENLFSRAVQAGQASPGARLGAGLAALGTRLFGGEGEQVQRAQRMKRARERISQEIGDPSALLRDDQAVSQASAILQEEGLQREAQTLPFQIAQFRGSMPQPAPQKRALSVTGGTPMAERFSQRFGVNIPEGETFELQLEDGRVVDINRLGSATNVTATATANQAEELTPFQKALNEGNAGEVERIIKAGGQARVLEPTIARLQDVATDPNVKSGTAQPYITGIQGLAESVGIDISGIADSLGIDMGDLSTKEELSSLGSRFTVDLADKISGNLNTTEINLLRDSGAQLGKSPEANLKVIANIKAANEIAKEYSNKVQSVTNQSQFRQLQQERDARGAEVFRERRDAILAEMKARRDARRQSQGQGGSQESEGRNIPEIDINAAQSALREGEQLGNFDASAGPTGAWPILDSNGNPTGEFIVPESTGGQ